MNSNWQLIKLKSVDSTNRFLKDFISETRARNPVVCITEQQTAGYGQQNRRWQTNADSAIFSIAYPLSKKMPIPGLFSLQVASLLHKSLTNLTSDALYLKWPNDLYNSEGKVAGILIEQVIDFDYQALIIGIGINRSPDKLTANASNVSNFCIEQLIEHFLQQFKHDGFLHFSPFALLEYWNKHDLFTIEESIHLITKEDPNTRESGEYLGINPNGQALIRINGKITPLSSGQSSIRKASLSVTQ